jgi:hypothetical protein
MLLHWSVKYVIVVLAILADVTEDIWMDSLLASRGLTPHAVFWDDLISGSFVGLALLAVLMAADRGKRAQHDRLRLIAEMNHHVRNALQVIYASAMCSSDKRHLDKIGAAVDRIDWALREILPGRNSLDSISATILAHHSGPHSPPARR